MIWIEQISRNDSVLEFLTTDQLIENIVENTLLDDLIGKNILNMCPIGNLDKFTLLQHFNYYNLLPQIHKSILELHGDQPLEHFLNEITMAKVLSLFENNHTEALKFFKSLINSLLDYPDILILQKFIQERAEKNAKSQNGIISLDGFVSLTSLSKVLERSELSHTRLIEFFDNTNLLDIELESIDIELICSEFDIDYLTIDFVLSIYSNMNPRIQSYSAILERSVEKIYNDIVDRIPPEQTSRFKPVECYRALINLGVYLHTRIQYPNMVLGVEVRRIQEKLDAIVVYSNDQIYYPFEEDGVTKIIYQSQIQKVTISGKELNIQYNDPSKAKGYGIATYLI